LWLAVLLVQAAGAQKPKDDRRRRARGRALKAEGAAPQGTLLIEGKFVTIDPGSRAKRYFAGFGAGKSVVKVAGQVKDSAGRTLATFEQQRVGTMGVAAAILSKS
jgi:hypothetical protein